MSRVFSKVTSYDAIGQIWLFFAEGVIMDEDDFLHTDYGTDIFISTSGRVEVTSEAYMFGSGESEKATEADIKFLIDHSDDWEEILQPDHLNTYSFTIYPNEYEEE